MPPNLSAPGMSSTSLPPLTVLFAAISNPMITVKMEGRVTYCNQAWLDAMNLKVHDVLGRSLHNLTPEVNPLCCLDSKNSLPAFNKIRLGSKIFLLNYSPLTLGVEPIGALALLQDVSPMDEELSKLDFLQNELKAKEAGSAFYDAQISKLKLELQEHGAIFMHSPAMRAAFEMALNLANLNSSILLRGEPGTGKGMMARLMHRHSSRGQQPFTVVNCARLPERFTLEQLWNLAGQEQPTLGGSILLKEVGELSLELQSQLYKIIREKPYQPSARHETGFFMSSSKNLEHMVTQGLFNEDLYYHLCVAAMQMPPLRQRREDIVALAQYFWRRKSGQNALPADMLARFLNYDWPGNAFELAECINMLQQGRQLYFLPELQQDNHGRTPEPISLKPALERLEKQLIEKALLTHKTTRQAARALGIDQSSVVRKAAKYRIRYKIQFKE